MTVPNRWKLSAADGWLLAVLAVGLVARFWVGSFGVNYDFISWQIVVDLMEHGKNVYANTDRYNYGPVWFNILNWLDWLAGHDVYRFRHLLVAFLSAVDVGIFWVLWRRFGRLPAAIFFLNPASIIITGVHNQFDNFAILLGLWAVIWFGDDFTRPLTTKKIAALVLIGVSLMTKHILFLFPFWLAVKQEGLGRKLVVMLVPSACFLLGFAPYWAGDAVGIEHNVFLYSSTSQTTHYFYSLFVPDILQLCFSATLIWILLLATFGFVCRRETGLRSLLVYLAATVAFSPAITNQYLVIPAAFAAVYFNLFTAAYLLIAGTEIAISPSGLNLLSGKYADGTNLMDLVLVSLVFGLAWLWCRPFLLKCLQRSLLEVRTQLKRDG